MNYFINHGFTGLLVVMIFSLGVYLLAALLSSAVAQGLPAEPPGQPDSGSSSAAETSSEFSGLAVRQQLEKYHVVKLRTRELGLFLRDQLAQDQPLAGVHFNLLQQLLGEFALKSRILLDWLDANRPDRFDFSLESEVGVKWLAVKVTVVEAAREIDDLFHQPRQLRYLVQRKARMPGDDLAALAGLNRDLFNRRQQLDTESALRALQSWLAAEVRPENVRRLQPYLAWLQQSASWRLVVDQQCLGTVFTRSIYWSDYAMAVAAAVGHGISRGLGTAIAKVRWRNGHLYQHRQVNNQLLARLQPLDILYRKRYFALTNYTIPGHWVHAAVWLGSREQLLELGLWEHPAVKPFHEQIEQGRSVYEVQYNGLNFTPLEEFLNLDEVALTRVTGLAAGDREEMARIYRNLDAQRQKPYDYSFNIMAPDRVVCTEIIFLSFENINWPRKSMLGRTMILPDHLAELVFHSDSPLEFVAYYAARDYHQARELSLVEFGRTLGYSIVAESEQNRSEPVTSKVAKAGRKIDFSLQNGTLWVTWRSRNAMTNRRYTGPAMFVDPLEAVKLTGLQKTGKKVALDLALGEGNFSFSCKTSISGIPGCDHLQSTETEKKNYSGLMESIME